MERFSASIQFDRLLSSYDIEGSRAQARMLKNAGILSAGEEESILHGLDEIEQEIEDGTFTFSLANEDIHMNIEARLIEKTGDAGKKLHTGRSRNDQVSLDMRLYVKSELAGVDELLRRLLTGIVGRAEKEAQVIMPGYTHLQQAQVTTFGHYLMAYFAMFRRDLQRVRQAVAVADVCPLGSGAMAGSTLPLNREFVRKELGFSSMTDNSMDAVSDRDFVLEAVFSATMIMIHASRLAEDFIIFSTQEFSFLSLPDQLCTGSSLMPHKKNPDSLELTRGKSARVIGDLVSLLTLLKGLPLTYDRDLQEDKEPLFHAIETVRDVLQILDLAITGLTINGPAMEKAVYDSFIPATEMAEYLVLKGLPFREAHHVVGRLVRFCEETDKRFSHLSLADMKALSDYFDTDVFEYIDPRHILENRRTEGAASFDGIRGAIDEAKRYLTL